MNDGTASTAINHRSQWKKKRQRGFLVARSEELSHKKRDSLYVQIDTTHTARHEIRGQKKLSFFHGKKSELFLRGFRKRKRGKNYYSRLWKSAFKTMSCKANTNGHGFRYEKRCIFVFLFICLFILRERLWIFGIDHRRKRICFVSSGHSLSQI